MNEEMEFDFYGGRLTTTVSFLAWWGWNGELLVAVSDVIDVMMDFGCLERTSGMLECWNDIKWYLFMYLVVC